MTAIAVNLSLRSGEGHQAPPVGNQPGADLLNHQRDELGLPDDHPGRVFRVPNLDAISWALWASPPGSRGLVVVGGRDGTAAHAFNVLADSAGVTFLDGQRGTLAPPVPPGVRLHFLPLTPGLLVPPGAVRLAATDMFPAVGNGADARRDAELDLRFGELAGPSGILPRERGKLNALWRPLDDLPPALVTDNPQIDWIFTVTQSGQVIIGADHPDKGLDDAELEKLAADISSSGEEIHQSALAATMKNGHPTLAVAFDEQGRVVAQSARVSGELFWDRRRGRWEVNDKSGRYMDFDVRGEVYDRDRMWWLSNVASMMSDRLGVPVFVSPVDELVPAGPLATPRQLDARLRAQAAAIANGYLVPRNGTGADAFNEFSRRIERDLRRLPMKSVAEVVQRAANRASRLGLRPRIAPPARVEAPEQPSRQGSSKLTQQEFAMASAYFGALTMDGEDVFGRSRREMLLRAFRFTNMATFVETLHNPEAISHELARAVAQLSEKFMPASHMSTYAGDASLELSAAAMEALGVDDDVITLSHPLVVDRREASPESPFVTVTLSTGLTYGDWAEVFIRAGTRFSVTERFEDGSVHLTEVPQDAPPHGEVRVGSAVEALLDPPTRVTPGLGAGPDAGRADGSAAVVVPR
ncbi:toxin glutamine deamidase domain-containing protein, partial [Micromonospora sp. NPDC049274]|uniref:toxin glutamine deamidase domain-containing protein n=1 Tax=Micromonospora sp. NPDC049274 TaxID=3154829 RepID=UPI003443BDBC